MAYEVYYRSYDTDIKGLGLKSVLQIFEVCENTLTDWDSINLSISSILESEQVLIFNNLPSERSSFFFGTSHHHCCVSSITGRVVSSSVLQSAFKFYPNRWVAPRSVIAGQRKSNVYLDHAPTRNCRGACRCAILT